MSRSGEFVLPDYPVARWDGCLTRHAHRPPLCCRRSARPPRIACPSPWKAERPLSAQPVAKGRMGMPSDCCSSQTPCLAPAGGARTIRRTTPPPAGCGQGNLRRRPRRVFTPSSISRGAARRSRCRHAWRPSEQKLPPTRRADAQAGGGRKLLRVADQEGLEPGEPAGELEEPPELTRSEVMVE